MKATARLYLDTARLGQMCRSSQLAVKDFAKLSGEEALTLYGKNFLVEGFNALPTASQRRYGHLRSWDGIQGLKGSLLQLAGAGAEKNCLIASRSISLVRGGARLLARRCQRVFVPDFNWSPYALEVCRLLRNRQCQAVKPGFRRQIFSDSWTALDLIQALEVAFCTNECDGILLPAVTHDGIRLPIDCILARLRRRGCCFAIVDACQHLGHVPSSCGANTADVVIGGVHKWVSAGLPLGVAIASRVVAHELASRCQDDPLLSFTVSSADAASVMETVNVWPLFSCSAAVQEMLAAPMLLPSGFMQRLSNSARLLARLPDGTFRPITVDSTLETGILLLRNSQGASSVDMTALRGHFEQHGIDLSCLSDTVLRLSMPCEPFSETHLNRLTRAFSSAWSAS